LRQELSDWIAQRDWQIWSTLTFKPERRYKDTIQTKKQFFKFIKKFGDEFGKNQIEYFIAVERFADGHFTHLHSLLNGVDGITYRQIGETWRGLGFGREEVEKYEKDRGADYYLTKYVTKSICDWDFKFIKNKNLYLPI
jgi:hypothetical protein